MQERIVYLNGAFVPESEAKVSVLDSGFNAGDGVYDVTRTFRHKPFRLREHTERLFRSLRYTRIDCGMSIAEMEKTTLEVLERNRPLLGENDDCALWQVVSRGLRSAVGNRVSGSATVTVYSVIVNFPEFASFYVEGAPLVIPSTRRIPPECLESKAKITNKMNHNMASFEAKQVDPRAIPLMLDIHGNLSETSAHNFFLVIDGKLCTPSDRNVLGGITKATIFELARELRVEVVEGNYTPYDLYNAEEAFLASTSPTFVPIKTVNGAKIGNGAPGPVTLRLIGAWNKMVGTDIVDQALGHLEQSERDRLTNLWRSKKAA
ncbi:MAG TPA: aminotransferase class IV [Candidatus Binatia bacterium]|jgi:branched-chain amino acid aminotransferase|nr:aminotransferase class IV [Candidatus Binatia bacterium]